MRTVPFLAALLTGAAAALVAPGARAASKPVPESMTCTVSGSAFRAVRSQTESSLGANVVITPQHTVYSIGGSMQRRSKKGVTVKRTLGIQVLPSTDPRTPGAVPVTVRAGLGLGGSYVVVTTTDADPVGTTQQWSIDQTGIVPFTLAWKKFDPVTARLSGVFAGQMKSTEIAVRNLKFVRGKFAAVVAFNEQPGIPAKPASPGD